jgi:hypothetical protein
MVQLEGLDKLKKFNDLLACSIAPQPSTLLHVYGGMQNINKAYA